MRTPVGAARRAVTLCLIPALLLATPACHDSVRIHSHPPGAQLMVDGKPCGTIPEGGLPVDVKWWTFSQNHAHLTWPNGQVLAMDLEKSVGEPNHPEYLVLDVVLALFFIIPGVIAFGINGVGPEPQQHFYAPTPPPAVPAPAPAPAAAPAKKPVPPEKPASTPQPIPES